MSRAWWIALVLSAWVSGGSAAVLLLLPHAEQPAAAGTPIDNSAAWLAELNQFRLEHHIGPVQFDTRLADLLEQQARGDISLTQLLDQHAALCASGRWVVLNASKGEDLGALLGAHADSMIVADYTSAAIDWLTPTSDRSGAFRVLFCRPY